jgi:hypothetical protein
MSILRASKIGNFISEISSTPSFIAVAASDPQWSNHLANIERALNGIDQRADDEPAMIEIVDEIQAVIARNDLSLKQRLLKVGELLTKVRDAKGTHH